MRELPIRSCVYSLVLLLLLLSVLCPMTGAWRSFKVILTSVEFEANAKIVDLKVQLHNDSGDSRISVDVTTHADLTDVQLLLNVGLETEKPGNFSTLINRTVNFCKMMKQRSWDPLVRVIYDDLVKHGNIFKECPIRSGTYSLHNYKVDEEMLPSFLPEANFKLVLFILRPKNEMLSRTTIYGRIDKSKGFDNLKRFSLG
ncbi:uncharacterized protein LOC111072274 [Drosophila obscura]|uniref:uncharacterized protein LOC111072274 n=1 Tax=Drosophila obscura TaxID=7282 RepID=UPI001BB2A0CA|nr:uncharacterized protein LOC111072274 [Drosophila obscura]